MKIIELDPAVLINEQLKDNGKDTVSDVRKKLAIEIDEKVTLALNLAYRILKSWWKVYKSWNISFINKDWDKEVIDCRKWCSFIMWVVDAWYWDPEDNWELTKYYTFLVPDEEDRDKIDFAEEVDEIIITDYLEHF